MERLVLSPATTRQRVAPIPVDGVPHPNYARHLVARTPERFMACLPKTRVWGPNGLVILPDGSFAVQSIYGRNHLVMDRAYARPLPRRVIHKPGDYFTLLGKFSNSGNYSHWIHDGLLRLHGVQPIYPQA